MAWGLSRSDPLFSIQAKTCENETVEKKREFLLMALCIHLNEDPSSLFKDYLDSDGCAAHRDLEQVVFGIYSINAEEGDATTIPVDVGIVVEALMLREEMPPPIQLMLE
ncbi:hypothetical protein IRJ41_012797 [Triplophysa rosa]|uniref:Uncharacterized protein n=1 Tax=Triplophysa rosa TaxID=992332 RepID=A0A9W7WJQ2_TRIRA|nr:hypothetical protein IRJ41_012797 [Triplophysa rosa]